MATVISLNEVKESYNKTNNGLKEALIEEINRKIQKAVSRGEKTVEYEFSRCELPLRKIIQTEYINAGFTARIAEYTDQFDHNPTTSLIISGWAE